MRKGESRYGEIKNRGKNLYLQRFASIIFTLFIILFRLPAAKSQTQVYPVSVTTQITPPYSVNLADYVAPGCEQLKVIIVQRDLTQAPYRLYLKMEIELNGRTIIRTSPHYLPPAFTLEPGIPTLISGSSLAPFFDPANLEFTGYSRDQYLRTKILPEGAYVITFTAFDWTRKDVALSSGGAFFCYLAKTGPPQLNLPLNNASVTYSSPQHINFQWLPGTTSSPNSALSTKYRFELFEMRVGGMSPSEIVTNTRPIFVSETDRTSLVYSIAEPALEKGMRYVWRVKAYDILGRDYIRNNGLSEVFSFVYDEDAGSPVEFGEIGNFTAVALSPRKAKLSWDASEGYNSYKVFYRKKGNENKWYESETLMQSTELSGLAPGVIYECRVQGRRVNAWGSFSRTDTVLMPQLPVIECGSPFTPLNVINREPLLELMRLQEFDAGGFMVTVIDPYALTTRPGRFTGRGFVQVPLFGHKKIRCEFTDIFINTDYQMVEGNIRLLCDRAEGKNALWDIDEVFEGGSGNGAVIDGTEEVSLVIPDAVIADEESVMLDTIRNEILVITEMNDTIRIDIAEKLQENTASLTVQDSEGNLYSVDTKTGKAVSIGKVVPPGSPQQLASTLPAVIDDRKGKVIFEPVPGKTRFAFDRRNTQYSSSNLFTEVYKTMHTEAGELYDIPYKLIPAGETDVVRARAELKGKSIKPDSIVFRSGTGTIYKTEPTGNKGEYLLTIPSGKANDGIDIFATYTDSKGKTFVLGKMIVLSYAVRRPQLTLVPVNGNGEDIDPSVIKAELDRVYLPVAVDWQVTIDQSNFTASADSLDIKGSGLFSLYTEGMKKLNTEFILHKKESFDPSTLYLFMLQVSGDESATGDMPRGKQFGYIFTRTARAGGEEAFYRTIAHEVAHGAFSLSHTFDSKYDIDEKTTTNLLDYTAGTDLVKHQWDAIHNPGLVIGMFERDEEGMSQIIPDPVCTQKFLESFRWAYVNKKPLYYPKDGYPYFGHYAQKIELLDGITYNYLHVSVRENISFVPLLTIPQINHGRAEFLFGKALYFYSEQSHKEFSDYMFPDADSYNEQMNSLVRKISSSSTRKDILNLLSIMRYEEYHRLNVETRIKCLNKISEGLITADYTGCVNGEQIVINLVSGIDQPNDQKKLLESLLSEGSFMDLLKGLNGSFRKEFIFKISEYININYPKPNTQLLAQYYIDDNGTYNKMFLWEETTGQNVLYHSTANRIIGKFIITAETDWWFDEEKKIMDLSPYEYVGITAKTSIKYLDANEGDLVVIPAVLFHWLLSENDKDQAWEDLFKAIDAGLILATFGTYAEGKVIWKVATQMSFGMTVDLIIQASIRSLGEKTFEQALYELNYRDMAWSGVTSIMSNSDMKMLLGCIRSGIKATNQDGNTDLLRIIYQGAGACINDIFLTLFYKNIFKDDSRYMQMLKDEIDNNPNAVIKELIDLGIEAKYINSLTQRICKTTTKETVKKILETYGN